MNESEAAGRRCFAAFTVGRVTEENQAMRNVIAGALLLAVVPNATPVPKPTPIGCVAYQVCQTCYRQDGSSYTCNCHMECLPGIH